MSECDLLIVKKEGRVTPTGCRVSPATGNMQPYRCSDTHAELKSNAAAGTLTMTLSDTTLPEKFAFNFSFEVDFNSQPAAVQRLPGNYYVQVTPVPADDATDGSDESTKPRQMRVRVDNADRDWFWMELLFFIGVE